MMRKKILTLLSVCAVLLFCMACGSRAPIPEKQLSKELPTVIEETVKRNVHGTVCAAIGEKVLDNVSVTLGGNASTQVFTDAYGRYSLDFEMPTSDKIVLCFSREGYVLCYVSVGIGAFSDKFTVEKNVYMERATVFCGTVKDEQGNALDGVTIRIKPNIIEAASGIVSNTIATVITCAEDGSFSVGQSEYIYYSDGYTVTFTKDGYESTEIHCLIDVDRIVKLNVVLRAV